MTQTVSSVLGPWSNFYILTGSAAASLTGLMFVVITLLDADRVRKNPDGLSTFSTPTVAHFGAALLVSALLSVPWRLLLHPAVLLGLVGLYGLFYVMRLAHRTRRLSGYRADLEDWAWYTVLPFAAYGTILAGSIMLLRIPVDGLFAFAGGVIVLIFLGIHNAWDVVTFIATGGADEPPSAK